jgi:hypothetical protein
MIRITFFLLAFIIGAFILLFLLKGKETPKSLVFLHALFALVALVLLGIYTFRYDPVPAGSKILFVIAAAGGLVFAWLEMARTPAPGWFAWTQSLMAGAAFVALLCFAMALRV